MGLCVSAEADDYEHVKCYSGQRCLGLRHGEGTYFYDNGDRYDGQWRWNKRHGHGFYTHKNGKKEQGFFYRDEYIGTDHGGLFAATTCSCFGVCTAAQPLLSDDEESKECMKATRQRQVKMRQKRERQQKHDEIRKKYNLPESK